MSNLFSAERMGGATRVSVWTQPRQAGPFTAWRDAHGDLGHGEADVDHAHEHDVEPEIEVVDIEAVRAAAIAQGFAAGIEAGRREADKEREAIKQLAAGLETLRPEPVEGLGAMIAATVERLLHEVMGEVQAAPEALVERACAAAALIGEEARPAVLKLNPADLARIDSAALPVEAVGDDSLAPGELRLETASGCIEDGPSVRLERLRLALDRVAGTR